MKKLILCAIMASSFAFCAHAQFSFMPDNSERVDRKGIPTTINADAMDIDIGRNRATFMGNVRIDDPEILITCRRMTLFFSGGEKKKSKKKTTQETPPAEVKAEPAKTEPAKTEVKAEPAKTEPAKTDAPEKDDSAEKDDGDTGNNIGGGRKLSRIECAEDVVIIRKTVGEDNEQQKATAGKAVYDLRRGTITLTDHPVVTKGTTSTVRGERLILYTDSERVEIQGGGGIETTEIGVGKNEVKP